MLSDQLETEVFSSSRNQTQHGQEVHKILSCLALCEGSPIELDR